MPALTGCCGSQAKNGHLSQVAPVKPVDLETVIDGKATLLRHVDQTDEDVFRAEKALYEEMAVYEQSARLPYYPVGRRNPDRRLGFDKPARSYEQLLSEHAKKNDKFVDGDFVRETLLSGMLDLQPTPGVPDDVFWVRPSELGISNPQFMLSKGLHRLQQGQIGNCWFIAAVNSMMRFPALFNKVICAGQSFTHPYGGIFRFRLWLAGHWVEVCVDDMLPALRDAEGNYHLCFSTCLLANEMWGPLLEKAFAKLVGGYKFLQGGWSGEAMENLTGALIEVFSPMREPRLDVASFLTLWNLNGLMTTWSNVARHVPELAQTFLRIDAKLKNLNLKYDHAYTVCGVAQLAATNTTPAVLYICLRDPYGRVVSPVPVVHYQFYQFHREWSSVPGALRAAIKRTNGGRDDEIWLPYWMFGEMFTALHVGHIDPATYTLPLAPLVNQLRVQLGNISHHWKAHLFYGKWTAQVPAPAVVDTATFKYDTRWAQFAVNIQSAGHLLISLTPYNTNRRSLLQALAVFRIQNEALVPRGQRQRAAALDGYAKKTDLANLESYSVLEDTSLRDEYPLVIRKLVMPAWYVVVPYTLLSVNVDYILRIYIEVAV